MARPVGTPLAHKLGYRPNIAFAWDNAPRNYPRLLGPLPHGAHNAPESLSLDLIHAFCTTQAQLEAALMHWMPRVAPAGALWISWPQAEAGPTAEIGEHDVRAAGQTAGLAAANACKIDDSWRALRFARTRAERVRRL